MVGALKGEGWNPLTNYVINSLNILLECIEKNALFKIREQLNVFISNSLQRKMID